MSRITRSTVGFPSESSTHMIQQSIESSLDMLKEEKKAEKKLNKEIKKLEDQLLSFTIKKTSSPEKESLQKNYSCLLKQVETSVNQINLIQSENKTLKDKVEDLRLESCKYKRIIGGLQQDLRNSSNLARARSQSKLKEIHNEEETKQKINLVLSKSTTEKINLTSKINSLATVIKQNKQEQFFSLQKHANSIQNIIDRPLSALDIDNLVHKINSFHTQKIKSLSNSFKSFKHKQTVLNQGFESLKFVSGLSNPDEIADALIVSEQRILDISCYLLKLNADIESLEFTNKAILANLLTNKKTEPSEKAETIKKSIEAEKHAFDRNLTLNLQKNKTICEKLSKVDKKIEKILSLYTSFPHSETSTLLEKMNEKTIEEKLLTLEEVIHQVLIYKALLNKKNTTTFGNISYVSEFTTHNDYKHVKKMIDWAAIPEEFESEDNSPKNVNILKIRAKKTYEQLSSKGKTKNSENQRSITPNIGVKSLFRNN